jgi:hypothetical protein
MSVAACSSQSASEERTVLEIKRTLNVTSKQRSQSGITIALGQTRQVNLIELGCGTMRSHE